MDFELSDEQRLLKDSVERLTTQRYDFETRKKFMAEPDGWSRDMWRQYADLGLTALPFSEEHGGIGLFLVDAKQDGVSRRGYPTMDGLRAAEISLANVKVGADAVIGEPGNAYALIERVTDSAIAALAAEAVGAMGAMHEITVDYLKQRKQFGVPIGNFQVLQHRAGDMLIALEQARSMAMLATMMSEEENAI